jgi:localization factor PodJL
MSFNNNQGSTGGFRHEVSPPSSYSVCGAGELKLLLQRIAEYIANADERQQAALGEMQSRLAHLADEAQSVRTSITPELAAAFARIEESISTLTKRVAADDHGGTAQPSRASELDRHTYWPGSSHEDPAFGPKPGESNARYSEPIWSRSRTDPPPPLRSAAGPSHFESLEAARPRPSYASAMADPYPDIPDAGDHGVWDTASAEALARSYEPEHFGDKPRGQSFQNSHTQQHAGQPYHALAPERSDGQGNGTTGDHFEQRFAELADRVEEALVELRTNSSVTALRARLDSFDQKLGSAISELATRADVEKLRAVEAHISELARHVDRAQHRLARLDEIEHNLTRLIDHLSDERLAQLFDQRILSEPRLAALAEAVAERLSARETARGDFGSGLDRLGELHDIIEQFVNAQRREGEQTASALEAIQEAMLNVLDRMEALEGAHTPAPPARRAIEADWRHESDGLAAADSAYGLQQSDQPTVSSVFPREWPRESKPASEQPGIEAELEQLRSTVRIERADQASAEAASREEATAVVKAENGTESSPLRASREDFLAAARRAARKASAQTMEETADVSQAKVRLQQAGNRRAAGARPVTGLLVATLAVALAVGIGVTTYSIFKGDLAKPWGLVRGALVKGGTAATAPAGAGQGKAAGGLSDGGSSSAPAGTTTPEVIIDPPGARSGPGEDDSLTGGPRSVTTLPGGIIIDNGSLPPVISAAPARAAFSPDTRSVTPQPAQAVPPVPARRMMPPAAVGPLSLRLAAANGDPSAEFEVAVRLDEGRGVERNLKEAVIWYQRSASRGFAPAQYRLGTLYERGLGVAADRGRAMAWYRSAADKGNLKAMHNFAVLSASGDPADYKTAAHWFSEAAERGLVDSQYNLAVLYETGRGVDRDLKQAYKWFALAARSGDKDAMRRRDRVKWLLNANELKAAEGLVQSWHPQPAEPLVNNVRAAGEVWKQREVQG